MNKNDLIYLQHIKESIETIKQYLGDIDYSDFCQNKMMIDAVVKELEIIGEAANNLSEEFRNSHPAIPFRDMIDMRNFLIHEYFGINTKTVWHTCKKDLEKLVKVINDILS